MNNPEWIIVHVTATTPDMGEVDAYWVDRLHRGLGWNGGGYHEIITRPTHPEGPARQNKRRGYPTRALARPGAHVGDCGAEWNRKTIGISLVGGIDSNGSPENNVTEEQFDLLHEAIREYQAEFGIPDERVIGHRDLIKMTDASPKACPCFSVQHWFRQRRFGSDFRPRLEGPADGPLAVPGKYRVRRWDTLWGISQLFGVSVETLRSLNPDADENALAIGQELSVLRQ